MSESSTEDLVTSFEQLSRQKKVEVIQEFAYVLSQDLEHFNDPVLDRETDVLCGICDNVQRRLEEIKVNYGVG